MTVRNPNFRPNPAARPDPNAVPTPQPQPTPQPTPQPQPEAERAATPFVRAPWVAPAIPAPELLSTYKPAPAPEPMPKIESTVKAVDTSFADELLRGRPRVEQPPAEEPASGLKPDAVAETPAPEPAPAAAAPETGASRRPAGWTANYNDTTKEEDRILYSTEPGSPEYEAVLAARVEETKRMADTFRLVTGEQNRRQEASEPLMTKEEIDAFLAEQGVLPSPKPTPQERAASKTKKKTPPEAEKGQLDLLAEMTDPGEIAALLTTLLDGIADNTYPPEVVGRRLGEVEPVATDEAKVALEIIAGFYRNWTRTGMDKVVKNLANGIIEARRLWGREAALPFYELVMGRLTANGQAKVKTEITKRAQTATGYLDVPMGEVVETTVPAELAFDPSEHTVKEVKEWLEENALADPRAAIDVIKAEMRGRNRKGITGLRIMAVRNAAKELEAEAAPAADHGLSGDEHDWAGPTEEAASLIAEAAAEPAALTEPAETTAQAAPDTEAEADAIPTGEPKADPKTVINDVLGRIKPQGSNKYAQVLNLQDHLDEMTVDEIDALADVIASFPKSKIRQSIERNFSRIMEFLRAVDTPLTGDYPAKDSKGKPYNEHSEDVNDAIAVAFDYFGFEGTKDDFQMLVRAFLVYRGIGTDRAGKIFGKDAKEFKIEDAAFIEFLEEIVYNTEHYGWPFAYTNKRASIGGVERYPAMMSVGLARWFASAPAIRATAAELLEWSVDQHNKDVWPRMKELSHRDQIEAWLDLNDTIGSQKGHPARLKNSAATPRRVDARISAAEARDAASLVARMFNNNPALRELQKERQKMADVAVAQIDKRTARGGNDRRPKTSSETNDPTLLARAAAAVSADGAVPRTLRFLTGWMRFSRIVAMPALLPTGFAEKGVSTGLQKTATPLLRGALRMRTSDSDIELEATEESKKRIVDDENVEAYEDMVRILITVGFEGVIDAALRGVKFEHMKVGLPRAALNLAMKVTTGDIGWKKATMQVFLDHYLYQLERTQRLAQKEGRRDFVVTTAADVEQWLVSDPQAFWREVALSPEGREALRFAADTSLGGIDYVTNQLRKLTQNEYIDFALAVAFSPFLKFGVRALKFMIPFSSPMLYLTARGFTKMKMGRNPSSDKQMQAQLERSYVLAGNEEFWRGLGQNFIADLPRLTFQLVVAGAIGIIAMLGLEEPDDDEDESRADKADKWYEYKICGEAVKTNWFFNELLGFAMPFAVAAHVAADGDKALAWKIFWNGVQEQVAANPWFGAVQLVDMVGNWDRELVEAQERADGFKTSQDISTWEFVYSRFAIGALKTTANILEPATLRQFHTDSTVFTGTPDLRRSAGQVYTAPPEDEKSDGMPPTTQTTWFDYQIRKETMKSPLAAKIANLIQGVTTSGDNVELTGYDRSAMPLVSIADPVQQSWFEELSVRDENDELVTDPDDWTDAQKIERVNTVLRIIENPKFKSASDIAAQGIVIPFEARHWTVVALKKRKTAIEAEFRTLDEEGKWDWVWSESTPEERGALKAARNKAWNDKEAAKAEVEKLEDLLFDDTIPYTADAYNQWEGNYRAMRTWNSGPKKGQAASMLDELFDFSGKIDTELYHAGDHKSSFAPLLMVDDQGADTYDAQTQALWQTDATDEEFVQREVEDRVVPRGFNEGKNVWDIASGFGGALVKAPPGTDPKLLAGSRGLVEAEVAVRKLKKEDYKDLFDIEPAVKDKDKTDSIPYRGYGDWSSGSDYTPSIYSHPAFSLNADKPAGLYSKNPQFTRFDYLRPQVATKGSREAYRREDF